MVHFLNRSFIALIHDLIHLMFFCLSCCGKILGPIVKPPRNEEGDR